MSALIESRQRSQPHQALSSDMLTPRFEQSMAGREKHLRPTDPGPHGVQAQTQSKKGSLISQTAAWSELKDHVQEIEKT